jgi:hypothetical protein
MPILADPDYEGAGHGVLVPFKQPAYGRELHVDNRAYNTLLRTLRSLGERGLALLIERWTASNTSPSAPAEPATSSAPPSSSPISNTAGSAETP